MAMIPEPVCQCGPWPGSLCGRGVIFSAVCEYVGGGVICIRSTCGWFLFLFKLYTPAFFLHHFDPTAHLPSFSLHPPPPFAPVITTNFWSIYSV